MMMASQNPILYDLVLIGAGHCNIQVMKKFAMNPIGGLRITVISDKIHAPYSGMLPGFLAGYYKFGQCHFDLPWLCQKYGFRFIHEEVIGIDTKRQKILFNEHPELSYDSASINVGISPKMSNQKSAHIIPIKPISTFVKKWTDLTDELSIKKEATKIAVVGGGAAGVEMTLILMQQARQKSWNIQTHLFQRGPSLVSKHDPGANKKLLAALKKYKVTVHLNQEFKEFESFDKVLLSSEAQAPDWFKSSHLSVNDFGFLNVDAHLKVLQCDNLFAAGDCIHFSPLPLKKSGVYAVRQGKTLTTNLRKTILKQTSLEIFKPKKNVLSLIVTGPRQAIAHQDKKSLLSFFSPTILWKIKNRIDLNFMKKFSTVKTKMPQAKVFLNEDHWQENTCGGCGSKIDASVLSSALKKLNLNLLNDDAAITTVSQNKLCLQSIDQFRSFISDPFLFAEIAVHHAFSDIYAMGGMPKTLMVALSLPPASKKIHREEIFQTMSGIIKGLQGSGASLVGGHTNEGAEFSLSLSAQGEVSQDQLLKKQNLNRGDHLILTKPLGTGVILAGHMEGHVSGTILKEALQMMQTSNGAALPCLQSFAVRNCTDITGFGLAGHLNEMLDSRFGAIINYSSLPQILGADKLFEQKIRSSISKKNRESLGETLNSNISDQSHPFLFDPQTSGGLLFSISPDQAIDCIKALKKIGYVNASIIGEVTDEARKIEIKNV